MLHSRARHPLHRAYKIRPGSQSRYKCDVGRNSRHVCSSTHKRSFARQNNPDFGELPGSCDFLREYVDLAGGRVQGLLQIDLEALVLGAGTMVGEIEAIRGSRG